jgi:1,4-alpha-glucan branching enzyme
VLADQLQAPGVGDRFETFLRDVRRETHRRDIDALRAEGREDLALALERSARDYERALKRHATLPDGLLGALAPFARWTSAATHAVLPLLATDAGARLQVQTGVDAHRARFGAWGGGFWLPECAHERWLEPLLADAGVRATCVDFTDRFGAGAAEHLRPLRSASGPLLAPIDRETIELVWSPSGYPSHPRYRDYHALTPCHHHAWANDGAAYDPAAALAQVRADAADFVTRVGERLGRAEPAGSGEEGLVVCALDTELLGHWWYEGVQWLEAVVAEAERQSLPLVGLDEALARRSAEPPPAWEGVTTWGEGRDLSTWSGPAVAELAWAARAAELRVLAAGEPMAGAAARHLLALQSSDWAFLVARDLAAPYGRERAAAHRADLEAVLGGDAPPAEGLRNLAVHAGGA